MRPRELAKPRVVLLTRDSAYSRLFIQTLMADVDIHVLGIVYSTAVLQRATAPVKDMWHFVRRVGLLYAFYQAYVAWVLPRLKRLTRFACRAVLTTNDVNSLESIAWLRARAPDFLLSFHFNQRILESVIGIPKRAALNFHPSYLPSWRGVDPVLFALQEDDSVLGGSVHLITPEIDEGDILLREKLGNEHVAGLIKTNVSLFTLGGRMAAEAIGDFERFNSQKMRQVEQGIGHYDGWDSVGKLGLKGLWKALWATPRKAS